MKGDKLTIVGILCGKGGKCAGTGEDLISATAKIAFSHETHVLFFDMPLLSSITANVIFQIVQRKKKCSASYKEVMNIRCNQINVLFCKDHGIDFSVWLCRGYVWYARPALLGISILLPNTFVHFHFNTRWTKKCRFPTLQPLSKTKFSVYAWQQNYLSNSWQTVCRTKYPYFHQIIKV